MSVRMRLTIRDDDPVRPIAHHYDVLVLRSQGVGRRPHQSSARAGGRNSDDAGSAVLDDVLPPGDRCRSRQSYRECTGCAIDN